MDSRIQAILRQGLTARDVTYYYQPLYHVREERIDKAEVLLRVHDGRGGFCDTEALLEAEEALGQAQWLDKLALSTACRALPAFLARGIGTLCVNLSPAACQDARLLPEARGIMEKWRAPPECICVEITELAALSDEMAFRRTVRGLHDMGLGIAIDDFGKGHSSIQRMLTIPFHVLKLDKALVWGMGAHFLADPIVCNILRFAREQGITVVAEGVETRAQALRLIELGCDHLQGYYFSPPLPREEFFRLLDSDGLQQRIHCLREAQAILY